ncbi:MAG TPA: DUF1521 domain-containing protein [Pyrinomonadaceae bacterium]|jgi:hypothetical protein|nr:DUF1521 domain-containing protein [Pyrinomonadaceae bacterium]
MVTAAQIDNAFRPFNISMSEMLLDRMNTEFVNFLQAADDLSDTAAHLAEKFSSLYGNLGTESKARQSAPVARPRMADACHPPGSLRTSGDTVRTPGGYKIEMIGQHEWKITGPDGKSTRIWGDPHVDEGDGGKWDFKRNSTFMLGDGTRINVNTVPYGNGMTVTGSLEIISGNDRVLVGDIDKGKGNIGRVTRDGFQHANSFTGDVFVQGRETDDWSLRGREVIGSENGGESFKLGDNLRPALDRIRSFRDGLNWARSLLEGLTRNWSDNMRPSDIGFNPYNDGARSDHGKGYDRKAHARQMRKALRDIGRMFNSLSRLVELNDQVSRYRASYRQNV